LTVALARTLLVSDVSTTLFSQSALARR